MHGKVELGIFSQMSEDQEPRALSVMFEPLKEMYDVTLIGIITITPILCINLVLCCRFCGVFA